MIEPTHGGGAWMMCSTIPGAEQEHVAPARGRERGRDALDTRTQKRNAWGVEGDL